jgi:hypothetical protein
MKRFDLFSLLAEAGIKMYVKRALPHLYTQSEWHIEILDPSWSIDFTWDNTQRKQVLTLEKEGNERSLQGFVVYREGEAISFHLQSTCELLLGIGKQLNDDNEELILLKQDGTWGSYKVDDHHDFPGDYN